MADNKAQETKFAKEQRVLNELYKRMEPLVELRDQNAKKIGDDLGIGAAADGYVNTFVELGILERRLEYGTPQNRLSPGRHFHWTLLLPRAEAQRVLNESQEARRVTNHENRSNGVAKRPKRPVKTITPPFIPTPVVTKATPVMATSPEEEVRAIAGPDRDERMGDLMKANIKALRKDDGGALVEAARQYQNRIGTFKTKVEELASLAIASGIVFDKEMAMKAVSVDVDERLEVVASLLPYIDRLEQTLERLGGQLASQSGKIRDYDNMHNENIRLKERVRQMISARALPATPSASAAMGTDGR